MSNYKTGRKKRNGNLDKGSISSIWIGEFKIVFNFPGLYLIISRLIKIAEIALNLFHPNALFLYPPENVRKPKVFWRFQEVQKWKIGIKWVKKVSTSKLKSRKCWNQICLYLAATSSSNFLAFSIWFKCRKQTPCSNLASDI